MHEQKMNAQRNDMMVSKQQYAKKPDNMNNSSSRLELLINQNDSSFLQKKRPHEGGSEEPGVKKQRPDFTP